MRDTTIHRPSRIAAVLVLGTSTALLVVTVALGQHAELEVRRSRVSGLAASVTARPGRTIPLRGAAAAGRAAPAQFLREHGRLFGVQDPDRQLALRATHTDLLGHTHSTYHQLHRGVPVFGGRIKVHQGAGGAFIAANGDFYPIAGRLSVEPGIDAARAVALARAQVPASGAIAEQVELVVVDPGWYGDRSVGPHLAWHVILSDVGAAVREALFVDAHSGRLLDKWSLLHSARVRRVYDGGGSSNLPGGLARVEGDPPTFDADVDAAYDYAGDVYDYFDRGFGRDGIDDAGATLILTAHSTAPACPNAFWSGTQMVFCSGTVTDDITAHEIMHGVTQFTADLVYQNQSGQLNEAYSDIFGELIDLFNGDAAFAGPPAGPAWPAHPSGPGLDVPNGARSACSSAPGYVDGVRWMLGEDADAFGGAIRDMWDPTCEGDPDRAGSALQTCNLFDNGGVHSGSGVPNHAFAMMVDGKAFNGHEIDAMGPIKAGAVWYRALTAYLTPNADFEDAYWSLNQAATDLVGSHPQDPRTAEPGEAFTEHDAEQVDQALLAVEMNTPGRCGGVPAVLNALHPAACPEQNTIFEEDFEDGLSAWDTSLEGSPATPYDWVGTSAPLPLAHPGRAAFCADLNSACGDPANESAVHRLTSPEIQLPQDLEFPTLSFTHLIDSETGWDGGTVWIEVDDRGWQQLHSGAFYYNAYNRLLRSAVQGNTNPQAGRAAFTGGGGTWGTSLVSLSALVGGGETVRLRFDFGKDQCAGSAGWYIDDVRVYECGGSLDCDNDGVPDEVEASVATDLLFRNDPDHGSFFYSDAAASPAAAWAQRVNLAQSQAIERIRIWGVYDDDDAPKQDDFTVIFHGHVEFEPGDATAVYTGDIARRTPSGFEVDGLTEYEIMLDIVPPMQLQAGTHWIEIFNNTAGPGDTFGWVTSRFSLSDDGAVFAEQAPGQNWNFTPFVMSLELFAEFTGVDCNGDGLPDDCSLDTAFSADSGMLSPIGDGYPQSLTVADPPPAASDVDIGIRALGDFGSSSESLDVSLNGTLLEQVFASGGEDCPAEPDEATVTLAAATYNSLTAAGEAHIEVVASDSVDHDHCSAATFIELTLQYERPDPDCNGNAVLDACELATHFAAESHPLSPIGGTSPQSFTVLAPPPAASQVRIEIRVLGDFGSSSENMEVRLNGTSLGVIFDDAGSNCPELPDLATLFVDPEGYNYAVGGQDAVIELLPADSVNDDQCSSGTYATVVLAYDTPDPDCNGNAILDACEIAAGAVEDCDGNAVPDTCEAGGFFEAQSMQFSPLDGDDPHTMMVLPAPPAGGDVRLTLSAVGDLSSSSEFVDVYIDDVVVGTVFTDIGYFDCQVPPPVGALAVPAAQYNALVADGRAEIRLQASEAVSGSQCTNGGWIRAEIDYALPDRDCDDNGHLDVCDISGGAEDCDGDGRPDDCQLAAVVSMTSPELAPLYHDITHTWRVLSATPAASEVTLTLWARGDLASSFETLAVSLDGTALGELFGDAADDCPEQPEADALTIPAAQFNAAVADGEAAFTVNASNSVTNQCVVSTLQVLLDYEALPADCDGDGVLDSCALDSGQAPDCNHNDRIDSCDLAESPELDCDGDDAIDTCQIAEDPQLDCNTNDRLDSCDIAESPELDCDGDDAIDTCQIAEDPQLDCNTNDRLDSCDIAEGDSLDLNGNGVPDECETLPQIIASVPPDGAVDARQPLDPQSGEPAGWDRVTLTFDVDVSDLTAADFAVQSSGMAPAVEGVIFDGQSLTLLFDGVIAAGECTSVVYTPGGQRVRLGYLPGNVNGDSTTAPLDILALIDHLNGAGEPLEAYQCDANRSGTCEPLDILRIIDLLNGAGDLDAWNGRTLPECP